VLHCLLRGEANKLTAHYFLLAESADDAKRTARRAATGVREAATGASPTAVAASAMRRVRSMSSPQKAEDGGGGRSAVAASVVASAEPRPQAQVAAAGG
jgi:hypothetical protein